jgi:hypothetical protein
MKLIEKLVGYAGGAKLLLIVPLPRYVLSACCCKTSHVANRLDPEFTTELSGAEKSLAEVVAAGDRTSEARIVNILSFIGSS